YAAATPPGRVALKERKDWNLNGQRAPRRDIPSKVDGTAGFGLDVRLPGMLYAAIRQCPMLGGAPGAIDIPAALAMPGVERVLRLPPHAGSTAGLPWSARAGGRPSRPRRPWQLTGSSGQPGRWIHAGSKLSWKRRFKRMRALCFTSGVIRTRLKPALRAISRRCTARRIWPTRRWSP
ncbi:MAG: hypothetical protein Q8S56_11790, partial [Polaromonas sp.]|nr:hypothetical protein [Polaromonas sp.]